MKQYDYNEAKKIFLDECVKHDAKIVNGTGKITVDGDPFDICEFLKNKFGNNKHGDTK